MLDFLSEANAEWMERSDYKNDYRERNATAQGIRKWKLERQQCFREPGYPSWEALARGDWEESLRLMAEEHGMWSEAARREGEKGTTLTRIRVVEKPIVPYLQWEMHSFQVQVGAGYELRIVASELIDPFEEDGPLPELINVGADTLYRIAYDEQGVGRGALRYTGEHTVSQYAAFMEKLWVRGEDFTTFFEREVVPLPPPRSA